MREEVVRSLCGEGEPLDVLTAAALGLQALRTSPNTCHGEGRLGWNALMFATYYHRKDIIAYLVSTLQNSQTRKSTDLRPSTTPLSLAVLSGDLASVQLLCALGDIDELDSRNKTALWWSVETNQLHIASFLLSQGASSNILCEGQSCIGVAAKIGNTKLVELLLQHGANVHSQPAPVPLVLAMESSNLQTISLLLKHVIDKHGFEEMLRQVKLDKYLLVFQSHNIQYQQFINMTDTDLKNCGISLLGPRKKLGFLITLLKQRN